MAKISVEDILRKKGRDKITMLTCYDYSFARILDEAGIDIILVGDSLANVVLGMDETRKVSVKEMLNHTKAVAGAVRRSLVVADMPYLSYQQRPSRALYYAKEFIRTGADAVKIEWFSPRDNSKKKKDCVYVIKELIKNKIPVIGHIGLTPQTVHLLGGYKVQGRDEESALKLIAQAKTLEELGVFSVILECIPDELGRKISDNLKVPTIGIGAGSYCDGQVLVLYDLLGLYREAKLKFVRIYCDLSSQINQAVSRFCADVKRGEFPSDKESFSLGKRKGGR